MGLQPLACWDCSRIPPGELGCLSLVRVELRQAEFSAMSWSLIWRIPTECNVSKSDGEVSTVKRPWTTRGCHTTKRQCFCCKFFSETATLRGLWNQNQKCSYSENQCTAPILCLYFHKTYYSEFWMLQLLISSTKHLQGMDKTIETTHNIGNKMFALAALKEQ